MVGGLNDTAINGCTWKVMEFSQDLLWWYGELNLKCVNRCKHESSFISTTEGPLYITRIPTTHPKYCDRLHDLIHVGSSIED